MRRRIRTSDGPWLALRSFDPAPCLRDSSVGEETAIASGRVPPQLGDTRAGALFRGAAHRLGTRGNPRCPRLTAFDGCRYVSGLQPMSDDKKKKDLRARLGRTISPNT